MERQVLMDMLSEFLMAEHGSLMMNRVAASRCANDQMRQTYHQFADQAGQHQTMVVRLIEQLGGDPNFMSPMARMVQVKAHKILESAFVANGMSQQEVEMNDLGNVLLAETACHANWRMLTQFAQQTDDQSVRQALEATCRQIESQEDQHVAWAQNALNQMSLQMLHRGPVPAADRWQRFISGPVPPISQVHPAPMSDGSFLPSAHQSPWQDTPVVRMARQG